MKKPLATLATLAVVAALLTGLVFLGMSSRKDYLAGLKPGNTTLAGASKLPVHRTPVTTITTAKGNGPGYTAKFTVPPSAPWWQVNWSYNCHAVGIPVLFNWIVYTSTGLDLRDFGPNQLGWGYSGSERYYDHGTFYLDVSTVCAWSIQVIR